MKKLFFILTSALLLIPEFINAGTPIDSIVFDNSYESNYYFEANLSSLISGRYVLNIFAYGMWWVGEFELY